MVASPKVWVLVDWRLPLNQTEATASKCAQETLRHQISRHLLGHATKEALALL